MPSSVRVVPIDSVAFFTARLTFQTDVADVRAALDHADPGFVLVDSRGTSAWRQGRIPGAVHLPTAEIPRARRPAAGPGRTAGDLLLGPGCKGATRAALAFAQLGYRVREMIGDVEYWIREGFPIETDMGTSTAAPDPLTAPCGC